MPRSEGAHVTYLLVDVTMESAAAVVNIADITVHGTQIAALMHAVNATPQQRYAFVRNGQTLGDAIAAASQPASEPVAFQQLSTTLTPAHKATRS